MNRGTIIWGFLVLLLGARCEDNQSPVINEECSTDAIAYSSEVSEILFQNCTYCHSTALATGGVVLDTYEDARVVGENGQLIGAIIHAPGFSPMPQGAARLPDCEIEIIQTWVNAGFPE